MMWKDSKFEPSDTRNYVAVCYKDGYRGHFFRQFSLPEYGDPEGSADENGLWLVGSFSPLYENTCATATWYFTAKLYPTAVIECSIPLEQYLDCKDQDELNKRNKIDMERLFPKKTVQARKKK